MLNTALTIFIALVWLINGLYCKLLNRVPRHQQIVARILGAIYARALTKTIGLLEIAMSAWVLSGLYPVICAWLQIVLVAVMNTIEYFKARDLLLFGKINAIIAILFNGLIYFNTFILPAYFVQNPV
ncbi:MAG: hypothetical protein J7621_12500 [Niastella sp.]|nr:hypothetical protein [Niastella sp.]